MHSGFLLFNRPLKKPLVIQYLNLLHKHGDPNALAVRRFVAAHVDDKQFTERAYKLRTIFTMSKELLMDGLKVI